jgi:hypothetical protein
MQRRPHTPAPIEFGRNVALQVAFEHDEMEIFLYLPW